MCISSTHAQDPKFEIEVLFHNVRIPTVTVTTRGTLLAFADKGQLLRRSSDGGNMWVDWESSTKKKRRY